MYQTYSEVAVEELAVGQQYTIHPSEAFQGIEEGRVTIGSIIVGTNIPDIMDQWQQETGMTDDEMLELHHSLWVCYTYRYPTESCRQTDWMPAELFVEHISK